MVWKENRENAYCETHPRHSRAEGAVEKKNYIDPKLYKEYNVKRGLRDEDGRGVLTGLTRWVRSSLTASRRGSTSSPRTVCFTTGASIAGSW